MRLATVRHIPKTAPFPALSLQGGRWIALSQLWGQAPASLEAALTHLADRAGDLAIQAAAWTGPSYAAADLTFLPPIPQPRSLRDFYAFEAHVKTARAKRGLAMVPAWYDIPVFYFSNPCSLVGHEDEVWAPASSSELDYELELAVVVGKEGRDIPPEKAWDHVAGLTILNDFSARDLQRAEMAVGLGPSKGKDFASGLGPWIATLDEVRDRISGPSLELEMTARVNGRERSRGNTRTLYHSIPTLIAHASRDVTLHPGEILGTGTVGTGCILELGPETCGGWLRPGDLVELEIERLGILRHAIGRRPDTGPVTD